MFNSGFLVTTLFAFINDILQKTFISEQQAKNVVRMYIP